MDSHGWHAWTLQDAFTLGVLSQRPCRPRGRRDAVKPCTSERESLFLATAQVDGISAL